MEEKPFQTQVLWNRQSGVQGRLREPKLQAGAAPPHSGDEATVKTTVLRAEAPEFIPAAKNSATCDIENRFQKVHITVGDGPQYSTKHSAQSRINKVRGSSQPNEQNSSSSSNAKEEVNGYAGNNISTDLIRLKQIISSLVKYPGQFDDLLMVFMETIYPYLTNILAMSQIAELLVSQAINCPNFRYNGVRLCWYLEQKCPEFRAEIHMRCTKELQENINQQNVVLFIAELYTQLPHDSLYGALLIDSLKKLLISEGSDNIKCVCQALKLTGYSLETNHSAALDELFSQLREFKNSLSGSALILLNSVINLRESNWGRTSNESSNSDSSDFDHQDYEDMVNGIVYETDGQALTNEEQEFLMTNATHDEYIIDNEDPDALCDPEPEMDEEIRAAFEEFVKFSKG